MHDPETSDGDRTDERETVDVVASEFVQRYRRGEFPSVTEYVAKYPEHADELNDLLPAVAVMEQLKKKDQSHLELLERQAATLNLSRLGDFRIIREIGRGGMGVVYEAEQESLGRHVALKVLSPSTFGSGNAMARFRREAETVARLHHSNIVPVFGVGEENGLHYYVMQLIDGQPLDAVITSLNRMRASGDDTRIAPPDISSRLDTDSTDVPAGTPVATVKPERRGDRIPGSRFDRIGADDETLSVVKVPAGSADQDAGSPPAVAARAAGNLSVAATRILAERFGTGDYWRVVAELGVQVARALDYAHQYGVWHRDIKPGNLLLDGDGIVWMVDFGLARLAEDSELTQTGDLLGTLRYMAPEQLSGQFDERSDIYSLGLTLFELLTLQPAHRATLRTQLLQQVTESDVRSPRSIDPEIPRDLDTVILKATSRDPAHRYQTAGELADDLQRYLDGFPISARRAGWLELLLRWRKRNPALAATSLAAVVSILAVAVISTWGFMATREAYQQLTTEQQLVIEERDNVRQERQKAIAEGRRAEENLDFALTAFEELLGELSARSSSLAVDFDLEEADLSMVTMTTIPEDDAGLLLKLLDFYRGFAAQNTGSPRAATYAAKAQHAIGDIRQRLGQFDEAVAAYEEAIRQYEAASPLVTDTVEFATTLARLLNSLGVAESRRGNFRNAWIAHSDAAEVLRELPPEDQHQEDHRFLLAQTLNLQSSIRLRTGFAEIPRSGPGPQGPGGRGRSGGSRHRQYGPDWSEDRRRARWMGRFVSQQGDASNRSTSEEANGRDDRHLNRPPDRGEPHRRGDVPLAWLFSARRDRDPDELLPIGPRSAFSGGTAGHGPEKRHHGDAAKPPVRPQPPREPAEMIEKAHTEALALLTALVAEDPGNPRYQLELARSHLTAASHMGFPGSRSDEDAEAVLVSLQTAIRLLDQLVAVYPDEDAYQIELADALALTSPALERVESLDAQQHRLSRSVEIARKLHQRSPDVSRYGDRLGRSLRAFAAAQSRSGRDADALRTLQESAAVLTQVVENWPEQFACRLSLVRTLEESSRLYRRNRQHEQAAEALNRAVAVIQSGLPNLDEDASPPPVVRGMYGVLIGLLKAAGRHDDVERIQPLVERFSAGGPPHFGRDGYHLGRPERGQIDVTAPPEASRSFPRDDGAPAPQKRGRRPNQRERAESTSADG